MIVFDEERGLFTVSNGSVEEIAQLDARLERAAPGELWWIPPGGSFPRKVVSYLHSKLSGRADEATIAARRAQCSSCSVRRVDPDGREFCVPCGCGARGDAELSVKLTFAHLDCPLRKPGFSNAAPD